MKMNIDLRPLDKVLAEYGYPTNKYSVTEFEVPAMTAYDFFVRNCDKFSNQKCFDFMFNHIKYYQVKEKIADAAKALAALGIEDRDRVATLLPNIPETAYIQYGLCKLGAITDHIDPRTNHNVLLEFVKSEHVKSVVVLDVLYDYTIKPIEQQLKDLGIKDIVIVPSINSIHPALKAIINLKQYIEKKERIQSGVLNIHYWNDLINDSKYQIVYPKIYVPNEISVIVHSSGTSSAFPKAIPLTNENMNSIVLKHHISNLDLQPGKRFLHILPYFAAYGSINSAHLAMNLGMELIEVPEFNFENFGPLLLKYKPNIVLGVPNWWKMLTKDPRMQNADLSFLEIAVAGGDSITKKDEEEINDFFTKHKARCQLTKGHGMSEIGGCGTFTFEGYNNLAGLGTTFPTDRYVLFDKDGNLMPIKGDQTQGEAYIYSPSATNGIIDNKTIVEKKFIAGFPFIRTKDIIRINSDGTLEFSERTDRTFTRYDGYKVRPSNIEKVIESEETVQQCMVVEYEDFEVFGKMPIAHVVLNRELTTKEKIELINKIIDSKMLNSPNFTSRDIPKKWRFRESLPQTKMFKNDYRELIAEGLTGEEFTVSILESNLKIEDLKIMPPEEPKIKRL